MAHSRRTAKSSAGAYRLRRAATRDTGASSRIAAARCASELQPPGYNRFAAHGSAPVVKVGRQCS
eukprot:CAMPEP_0196781022 /NCGR_PEP_ID=MMETSP1104-20130614/9007_1 /TAXON_ID=33652 /ORGANISM="Cafeteria sp., Strain Caron Lab Isolate" /LENGTH=64 /DNA_ID=CAMNT_0042151239 /DNA_START=114 /DNA_END=305 /DNA_ORIENTATION=-